MRCEMSLSQRNAIQAEEIRPGAVTNPRTTMNIVVDVQGALDPQVLDAAFRDLIARHEPLRSRPVPGTTQMEIESVEDASLEPLDTSGDPVTDANRLAALLERTPVDLGSPPSVRGFLLTCHSQKHLIGLVFHHFAVDPTSLRLAVTELAALYTARLRGQQLPPNTMQYGQYARWQAERLAARLASDREAWETTLAGVQPPRYERDIPFRPGSSPASRVLRAELLDHTEMQTVLAWSRRHRSTLFTTLLAAFTLALRARTDTDDLVLATVFEQRDRPEARQLIGPFLYPTVLRLRTRPDESGPDWVTRVRTSVTGTYQRAQFPLRDLLGTIPQLVPGLRGEEPTWYRMFEYLPNVDTAGFAFGQAHGEVTHSTGTEHEDNHMGFFLRVRRTPQGALVGRTAYDAAEFSEAGALALLDDFRSHLVRLCAIQETASR
jgi:hypothetical protein